MYVDLVMLGCGLNLIGALILLLADAWFSRAVLIYLDALEENLMKMTEKLRDGGKQFDDCTFDVKRDRNQNRARFTKLCGWVFMIAGFAVQLGTMTLGLS